MGMDKPRFARNSAPARANHTGDGDLSRHLATAPAENDDLDEIKSAVLAKLALDLGKDASVATDRDWFVAAALKFEIALCIDGWRWTAPAMHRAASSFIICRWSSSSDDFLPMCSAIWVGLRPFGRRSGIWVSI